MKKVALITGVTGQDGAYLSEFLLKKVMKYMGLKGEHHYSILIELIICFRIRTPQIKISFYILVI